MNTVANSLINGPNYNSLGISGVTFATSPSSSSNKKKKLAIGLGVGLGVGIPVVAGLTALLVIRSRRKLILGASPGHQGPGGPDQRSAAMALFLFSAWCECSRQAATRLQTIHASPCAHTAPASLRHPR